MASRVVAEAVLFAQRRCTFCFLTITSFFFFIFLQHSGEVYITSTRAQNKLLFVAHSVNSCTVSGRRRVINWPPTRAAAPTAALDAESCAGFFIERCGIWPGVHIVRTENEIKNSSAQRIFVISHDGRNRWECGDEIQAVFSDKNLFLLGSHFCKENERSKEPGRVSFPPQLWREWNRQGFLSDKMFSDLPFGSNWG